MSIVAEQWDTVELQLAGPRDKANPFTDVTLTASFEHTASGRALTVDGFYDGDATWRIRFMPLEAGTWRYRTAANDPGLDGRRGTIECVAPRHPYLHGPLQIAGHHFRHVDGTWRYLISTRVSCQFGDRSAWPDLVQFANQNRINRIFFIMGGVHGTIGDLYGGTPEKRDFDRYDVEKFQAIDALIDALRLGDILAGPYFYYFNDLVQNEMSFEQDRAFVRYGMARFGAYCNVMPCLANQLESKYTGMGDKGTPYDDRNYEWGNAMGEFMKARAVFGVPVTVHNPLENFNATNPSFYTILRDWQFPWAHYMLRQMQVGALGCVGELRDDVPEQTTMGGVAGQAGVTFPNFHNPRSYAHQNALLNELRRFGVPVINEEPGYEMKGLNGNPAVTTISPRSWNSQNAETLLSTFWSAACACAYSMWGHLDTYCTDNPLPGMKNSVVPQYLRVMHDLLTSLPYWELEPDNEAISADAIEIEGREWRTNFGASKAGKCYVLFSQYGRAVELTVTPGTYRATRVNPRTGERTALPPITAPTTQLTLPNGEWVLLLEAD